MNPSSQVDEPSKMIDHPVAVVGHLVAVVENLVEAAGNLVASLAVGICFVVRRSDPDKCHNRHSDRESFGSESWVSVESSSGFEKLELEESQAD